MTYKPTLGEVVAVKGTVIDIIPPGGPKGAACYVVEVPGETAYVYATGDAWGTDELAPWPGSPRRSGREREAEALLRKVRAEHSHSARCDAVHRSEPCSCIWGEINRWLRRHASG